MPTYVYGCDACGYRFEKSQKFSDEPIRVCPQCQDTVRRIFQPAGIVFKGSGWHTTDYKRNGGGDTANGSDAKTDAKTDTKSEAKPDAAKSETKTSESGSTSSTASDAPKPAPAA